MANTTIPNENMEDDNDEEINKEQASGCKI